jgi:alkanesulfonate monooxygenase SsuD/methylene tetrahydromethanopterin reductase-like flavin-dependent oxidoreductase (luciferase family)
MEFALQYEIQRSRPHYEGFMYDIYHQATEQVKLADRLGYHSVWTVEHHFLAEWSYSSAPEVWYGALSQLTSHIRLGHGVSLLPIPFNHPARVAERIAVLDIMSDGRVECGTGRCGKRRSPRFPRCGRSMSMRVTRASTSRCRRAR